MNYQSIYCADHGYFVTSPFGRDRGHYLHSGIDFCHADFKAAEIKSVLDGRLSAADEHPFFGKMVTTFHSLTYLKKKLNDHLYISYCHLDSIDAMDGYISAGSFLGRMGNSGRCLTKEDGIYRFVSDEEICDAGSRRGVHLHLSFYQKAGPGEKTKLLKRLISLNLIPPTLSLCSCFYQWGRLFYAPRLIHKYLSMSV